MAAPGVDGQDWITTASIMTFGGASLGVWIISNTARKLLNKDTPWLVFIVSMLLAIAVSYRQNALGEPMQWLVTVVNACLLFCTATGLNETAVAASRVQPGQAKQQASRSVRWLMPWFTA